MTRDDIEKVLLAEEQVLRKHKVRSVALFGSYVRGEHRPDSDVDLLIDFRKGVTLLDLVDLQDSLSEAMGAKVNVVSRKALSKHIGPYILQEAETIGEAL